jgi:hypothetical protein
VGGADGQCRQSGNNSRMAQMIYPRLQSIKSKQGGVVKLTPLRQGRVLNLDGLLPKYQPGVDPAIQGALGAPYLLPDETSMPPRSD